MANKVAGFFAHHWLAVINVWLAIYVGLPLLAPVLMANGLVWPATIIYKSYLFLCHELPHRSYFLFGPQAVYSLQELVEAAGVDALWGYPLGGDYREFVGNAELGFKVSLCQRDMAIYSTMLLTGLVFSVLRQRVKPISVWVYFTLGLVPIGLDGVSQLLSYIVPSLMPGGVPRESNWMLRTLTGALFGWATMALALPYLHESFTAMEEQLAERDEPL
jgi:uncharacterized membrane protein